MTASFFTAVLNAQVQAQNDLMAVPDFIAGFMYGMTGFNHLEEIEGCYNGTIDLASDAQSAVSDILSGSYIRGFAEVGQVINEFPKDLETCKNMGDDIAAIEAWAQIFTQPKELTETLGKNWLLHRKTIK